MRFDTLNVNYVRNIDNIQIQPSAGLNLIIGPNASGKTALLEAMHLLSRARSFRTPRIKEVIQREQKVLQVSAKISKLGKGLVSTGIEKGHGSTAIKYRGEQLKTVSEQANNIPLITFTPDSHVLVTGGPKERRHWLDWALFHVEPKYIGTWRDYQKALRNRNNLLKNGGSAPQMRGWESRMVDEAKALDGFREVFTKKLQQQLNITAREVFSNLPDLSIKKSYPDSQSFAEHLEREREKDRQIGYTRYGPHKIDIVFKAKEVLIAQSYSRGQIKRFIASLLVAEARSYQEINGEKPVLLIDDFAAELDAGGRQDLLSLLKAYGGQIFLTSTEMLEDISLSDEGSVFHVERGSFNKMIK